MNHATTAVSSLRTCGLSTLYACHDSIWKNWRPLVSLLQIFGGRVAEFIDPIEKTGGEGTVPSQ